MAKGRLKSKGSKQSRGVSKPSRNKIRSYKSNDSDLRSKLDSNNVQEMLSAKQPKKLTLSDLQRSKSKESKSSGINTQLLNQLESMQVLGEESSKKDEEAKVDWDSIAT